MIDAKPPGGDRAAAGGISADSVTRTRRPTMADALAQCPDLIGKRDPFGFDTPANHSRAKWLAGQIETLRPGQNIHLRGLHYLLQSAQVTIPATSGRYRARPYTNKSADWLADTLKYARWLGYVPWEQITDERNARPVIQLRRGQREPRGWLASSPLAELSVPDVTTPYPVCVGVAAEQPNRIVLAGEKTSLRDVLEPISRRYGTDLFLCAGDLSDTCTAELASAAADDGRHTVIASFADADPQGFNMANTLCRKLAGHQYARYRELSWEVHRVALTPAQVGELGLPECELKGTVKQAALWRERHGIEQTEIDALCALQPETLKRIALDALGDFCDLTLGDSAWRAENRWSEGIRELVAEQLDGNVITSANAKLAPARGLINRVYERVESAVEAIELPEPPEQIQPTLPEIAPSRCAIHGGTSPSRPAG